MDYAKVGDRRRCFLLPKHFGHLFDLIIHLATTVNPINGVEFITRVDVFLFCVPCLDLIAIKRSLLISKQNDDNNN